MTRVIVACRAGDEEPFLHALAGLGADVEAVGEDEPLGRGGGLRLAATRRQEEGPVLALNGDELLDVDFRALIAEHEASGAAGDDRRRPGALAVRRGAGRGGRHDHRLSG